MFDPFGDFEINGYLRNVRGTKNLDDIKIIEHLAFESRIKDALDFLQAEKVLSYSSLKKVHEMLFSSVYPWAGKDRQEIAPSLVISKGSKESEYHTVFALPDEIEIHQLPSLVRDLELELLQGLLGAPGADRVRWPTDRQRRAGRPAAQLQRGIRDR